MTSKNTSADISKLGQRIFVFVIGGATRSEVLLYTSCFFFLSPGLLIFDPFKKIYMLSAPSLSQAYGEIEKGSNIGLFEFR